MIKATRLPKRRWRHLNDRRGPDARPRAWRFAAALLVAGLWSIPLAGASEFSDGQRAYAHGDYTRAAAILLPEAERGDADAQTYLGWMYSNGRGVPQDDVEAVQWLRRAADQGQPTAQFLLGLMVDKGHGVKQDFVEAEMWLNLAAAHAEPKQRDYWTRVRNAVAAKLTRDETAEAQKRALEWRPVQEP